MPACTIAKPRIWPLMTMIDITQLTAMLLISAVHRSWRDISR